MAVGRFQNIFCISYSAEHSRGHFLCYIPPGALTLLPLQLRSCSEPPATIFWKLKTGATEETCAARNMKTVWRRLLAAYRLDI